MKNRISTNEVPGGLPTHKGHTASRGDVATAPAPTHDEIAHRAYEIYVRQGRPSNQCKRNWRLAERELRHRPSAAASTGPPASGSTNKHSEVLNGKRPDADARLLKDVLSAPEVQ